MFGVSTMYNASDLDAFLRSVETSAENAEAHPMHPEVFEWVVNELVRYSGKQSLHRKYLTRCGSNATDKVWCIEYGHAVSDHMKPRGTCVEYGLRDPDAHKFGVATNGMPIDMDCTALGKQIEADLRRLCSERSELVSKWSQFSKWGETFTSRRAAETFIRDLVVPTYSKTIPRIAWISGWPVSPAVYDPDDKVLHLHVWLLDHVRKQDFAILALHEIVGHYIQENATTSSTSAQAENCAMSCEALGHAVMGSRVPEIEWKCMRLCRALLDLRMHIHYGKNTYPTPESVWAAWNQKLGGAFDHIVPLPSETLRVAALPGQALGYIMADVCPATGCTGCHAPCTVAAQKDVDTNTIQTLLTTSNFNTQ